MTPRAAVTEGDLLDALRAALVAPRGSATGQTVQDLARETGLYEGRIRKLLRKMGAEGRLVVTRTPYTSIDGRQMMVPAYRIKGDTK
jgi:predicted transcriptional regulator